MNHIIFLSAVVLSLIFSSCKKKYDDTVVSGYVTDSISGGPLHGVTMQLKAGAIIYVGSKAETLTDANGYYRMVYDTPSEGVVSIPNSYEVFAVKPGYVMKRAGIGPGKKSQRNFVFGEKYIQVKVRHYYSTYYNTDSTAVHISGEGENPVSESYTCFSTQTSYPEKNYILRDNTDLVITTTRYKSGTVSGSTFTKSIKGDKPIIIDLPV